jgi:hypothetical protein
MNFNEKFRDAHLISYSKPSNNILMNESTTPKTRITAFLDAKDAKRFAELTSSIGISRDALLNQSLPSELDYLAEIPANSVKALAYLRARVSGDREDKARINITLSRRTALRMNRLCEQKRVPRDLFIASYVDFLVNGDPEGSCISPLAKAGAMLRNPRHEYSSSAGHGPYQDLHISDEALASLDNLLVELFGTHRSKEQ